LEGKMNRSAAFSLFLFAAVLSAQTGDDAAPESSGVQTMKPLARGTDSAAASMMPQATLTPEHVMRAGGNAFDPIVAGQAVPDVVQPNLSGVGSGWLDGCRLTSSR
jgi:gamma-glutamyltranspeptidase